MGQMLARMAALDVSTSDTADAEDTIVYLWPETLPAWYCWQGLRTQWRVGMGGATGLDYAGVRAYLDERRVRGRKRRDIFECIQAAEHAALEVWAEQRPDKHDQPPPPRR